MRGALIPMVALVVSLLAGPGLAAGEADPTGKLPVSGFTVEMPFLVAPMSEDGKLIGYAYITSKLVCSSPDAAIAVREKLAFIQDSFVRDVNGRPVSQADDAKAVDRPLLNLRLTADARRIVGDAKVVSMRFVDIKYNPLHPTESTLGELVPPDQAAPQTGTGEAATAAGAASNPSKESAVSGESAQKTRPK